MLEKNENLHYIFSIVENSPELSPLIESNMINGVYELNIIYNTQQKNESVLELMNGFCKNLIEHTYE